VAGVKTVFYKYDTYMQYKTDCNSGAVVVQLVWLVGCGLDRVPYFPTDNAHLTYNAHPKLLKYR